MDNKETNLGTKSKGGIMNLTARIWTPAELRETVKQAKANGFTVTKEDAFTTITHPNGDTVLRSLRMGNREFVRIDRSYFEE